LDYIIHLGLVFLAILYPSFVRSLKLSVNIR